MTPRLRLALGLVAFALAGCDSNNPDGGLADLDGTYTLGDLVFVTDGTGVADADVGSRLDLDATVLEIFGADGEAELTSQFSGQARRRTSMNAEAARGRLTLTAQTADDEAELADLLLPPTFSLTYDATTPSTLSGQVRRTGINLEAFDPEVFAGQTNVSGNLRVRFDRTDD